MGPRYDVLSKLNPSSSMSMSAWRRQQPPRLPRLWFDADTGWPPSVVGDPDGRRHESIRRRRCLGGLNGCAAVLTALIHARLTGKGQFIDLAQIDAYRLPRRD